MESTKMQRITDILNEPDPGAVGSFQPGLVTFQFNVLGILPGGTLLLVTNLSQFGGEDSQVSYTLAAVGPTSIEGGDTYGVTYVNDDKVTLTADNIYYQLGTKQVNLGSLKAALTTDFTGSTATAMVTYTPAGGSPVAVNWQIADWKAQ